MTTETEITVVNRVGFDVLRNDHRARIMAYCREHDVNALALLGLYVHMAAKPDGWRFSYKRLANEIPGIGQSAVAGLLRHLGALGYYRVEQHRHPDGTTTKRATFDAGNTWPAQSDVITGTKAQSSRLGPPMLGGSGLLVSTEEPIRRGGARAEARAPEPPPGSAMDKDEPEVPEPTADLDPAMCSEHGSRNSDAPCIGCKNAAEYRSSPQHRRTIAQAERAATLARQAARRRELEHGDHRALAELVPADVGRLPLRERLAWLARRDAAA